MNSSYSELEVEVDLDMALRLKYANKEPKTSAALIDRVLQQTKQIPASELDDMQAEPSVWLLEIECAQIYAHWIKCGRPELQRLKQAYDLALQSAVEFDQDGYLGGGYALAAARLALIIDSPVLVEPALEVCKAWDGPAAIRMRDVLVRVANSLLATEAESRHEARLALSKLFDDYRQPEPDSVLVHFHGFSSMIRFELGVILAKLNNRANQPVDLQNVYDLVAT